MVIQITTIKRFQGLSTDDKPTDSPDGSTYHSVDTGEQWVCHDGMWVIDLRMAKALETL